MPETPEMTRKRNANILRNQEALRAIGFGLPSRREGALFPGGAGGGGGRAERSTSAAPCASVGASTATVGQGGPGSPSEQVELRPLGPLKKLWPGRADQIQELAGLVGEVADGVPVPPLLVTGPPSTGKTSVVRAVLDYRGFSYVHVNCMEVVAKNNLFEAVIEQTAGSREEIAVANRVDQTFRDDERDVAFVEEQEGPPVMEDAAGIDAEGTDEGDDAVDDGKSKTTRGRQQPSATRAKCSSWNIFFRQLAVLLAKRDGNGKGANTDSGRNAPIAHAQPTQQLQQQPQQQQQPQPHTSSVLSHSGSYGSDIAAPAPAPLATSSGAEAVITGQANTSASTAGGGSGSAPGNGVESVGGIHGAVGGTSSNGDVVVNDEGGKTEDVATGAAQSGGLNLGGNALTSSAISSGTSYDGVPQSGAICGGLIGGIRAPPVGTISSGATFNSGTTSGGAARSTAAVSGGFPGGLFSAGSGRRVVESFPRKLFVILDNAEALLGEQAAGVGVSAGGAGNGWKGPGLLARLARLRSMVASFTGFAGTNAVGGVGGATRAPVCPILISQNCFFASEIMADSTGGGGVGRSLIAFACPVQLRFPPYTQNELPDVLAATAENFGNDLNLKLRGGGGANASEGRKLFRKMSAAMVNGLRNENCDAWELGVEAAKLWPSYRKMAEDGCDDSELATGLKPLLKETTKRLHGGTRGSIGGGAANNIKGPQQQQQQQQQKQKRKRKANELGLSARSKYLLVSAYLASHNSRDTDRDVFTARGAGKKKRHMTTKNRGNAADLVDAGVEDLPEAAEFHLERLLSIMTSLVAASGKDSRAVNDTGSTELFAQLKSLTKLNLITDSGGNRKSLDLNTPTYRCNISRELAEDVAGQIGLTLSNYLASGR